MPIDFKNGKILSISLVYNIFKLKFQAIYEYINEILAKSFIISFKSSIKAFIIFIKKKNSKLYFCVNYYGINAIMKKKQVFNIIDA